MMKLNRRKLFGTIAAAFGGVAIARKPASAAAGEMRGGGIGISGGTLTINPGDIGVDADGRIVVIGDMVAAYKLSGTITVPQGAKSIRISRVG